MITINDTLHTNADTAMLKAICPDTDSICFFDIETTGFSRNYNIVYLIGAVYFRNGITHYLQWLAESDSDEAYILSAFNDFLKDFHTLMGMPSIFLLLLSVQHILMFHLTFHILKALTYIKPQENVNLFCHFLTISRKLLNNFLEYNVKICIQAVNLLIYTGNLQQNLLIQHITNTGDFSSFTTMTI